MKKKQKTKTKTRIAQRRDADAKNQAFVEHLNEVRLRLFWVVSIFLLASAAAYPFYHDILQALFAPLQGRQLVYLTPIGGFSFIIKICAYVGVVMAVPALVYHGYKFFLPVMQKQAIPARRYFVASMILALAGVAFAYFVLLPAALRFLTNLDIQQVSAMLTVDAYLNFVIAYVVGCALMFQLPIIILLINNVSRITPSSLMRYQRHVLLAAFIFAAVLSPTPDVVNQSLMAAPAIALYQCAIVMILFVNRKRGNVAADVVVATVDDARTKPVPVGTVDHPLNHPQTIDVIPLKHTGKSVLEKKVPDNRPAVRTIDGFVSRRTANPQRSLTRRQVVMQHVVRPQPVDVRAIRSVDGILSSGGGRSAGALLT